MVRYSIVCLALVAIAGQARATPAESMFDEMSRDFGSVPHGTLCVHSLKGNTLTLGLRSFVHWRFAAEKAFRL